MHIVDGSHKEVRSNKNQKMSTGRIEEERARKDPTPSHFGLTRFVRATEQLANPLRSVIHNNTTKEGIEAFSFVDRSCVRCV